MAEQTLLSFFQTTQDQRRALSAFFDTWGGPWSLSEQLLDHYEASRCAFDPPSSADKAFQAFVEIYDELKGPNWQVFRPFSPERDCWPPQQIFETINREFSEFSWRGPINLLTLPKSGARHRLQSSLSKMRGIKPNSGYPHMTVSKFLHFFNPGLFPIYDNAVIWERVFRRFRNDFREFCVSSSIPYEKAINDDTEAFLIYYIDWASSVLSGAHETFMKVFVDWLGEQPGADLHLRMFDPASLCATAFEIAAIGAAGGR
jgi:hypothetical protein